MTFRISAGAKEDPRQSIEVTEVTLHFDPDGLRDFLKFVQATVADFNGPRALDHYHFKDVVPKPAYYEQQRDVVSKDILITPYPKSQIAGRT